MLLCVSSQGNGTWSAIIPTTDADGVDDVLGTCSGVAAHDDLATDGWSVKPTRVGKTLAVSSGLVRDVPLYTL